SRIVAYEFDQKSEYRIDRAVCNEKLAVEFFAAVQKYKQPENRQHKGRFVKLGRVQVNAVRDRHARVFVAEFGKMHAPRKFRRLSPTAPRGKTSLTAECLSKRDRRSERIGDLPKRQ